MAETVNIGEIANRLSSEIFKNFFWEEHPQHDENFPCNDPTHLSEGSKPKPKKTHPGDVVYFYKDPYLGRKIYLHTDLKSYKKSSIGTGKIREAFKSLAMTIECARQSEDWRRKYSSPTEENFEIRGLLFVHNHDGGYKELFDELIKKANLSSISIAPNIYIHFLGPHDIDRLYSISNDLLRLKYEKTLPEEYTFYYPDLVMWRRHGDVWGQPATIEALTAPYFIIKYPSKEKSPPGYLIYYNRQGISVAEFEYFIDSLSRYQMLEPGELIRIRIVHKNPDENYKNNFHAAKTRYAKAWGFDPKRVEILDAIDIRPITSVTSTYAISNIGWRDKK